MGTLAFPLPFGGNGDGGSSPVVFQRALWAQRAQFQTFGNVVTFTDFGGGTAQNGGGLDLKWNGNQWKLQNSIGIVDRLDTSNPVGPGAGPFNMNPNGTLLKAGQFALYSCIDVNMSFAKSAAAETATVVVRIGTAFTVADVVLATISFSAAQISGYAPLRFRRTAVNQVTLEGNGDPQNSFGGLSTVATGGVKTLTAGDFDANDVRISIWASLSGASETLQMVGYKAQLESTDSL